MKPSLLFKQYVWLLSTLRSCHRITLEELNERWVAENINEGNPLPRSTFNRHREAISEMFGVVIECDTAYNYYIGNPEVLKGESMESWMLNTLTVGSVLIDSKKISDRIVLENVSKGEEFLYILIRALKQLNKVRLTYCRFEGEPRVTVLSPYALRLWHRRWYVLGDNGHHLTVYALDRVKDLELLEDEVFKKPEDFDAASYSSQYYGVLLDGTALVNVRLRVYGSRVNYFRTLPLHSSQQEVETTPNYSDFNYHIRPTADFIEEIMSYGYRVEVVSPESLRIEVKARLHKTLMLYESTTR